MEFAPHIKLTASRRTACADSDTDSDVELFRIEATRDFSVSEFRILKGDIGGWVESLENVKDNSWVEKDSMVFDGSVVDGNSIVKGTSRVQSTKIIGKSLIDNSFVLDSDISSSKIEKASVANSTVADSVIKPYADIYNSVISCARVAEYLLVYTSDVKSTRLRKNVSNANIETAQHSFIIEPFGTEDSTVHLYRIRDENGNDHHTLEVGCWTGTIDTLMDQVRYRRQYHWSIWENSTESQMDQFEQQYEILVPLLQSMKDSW